MNNILIDKIDTTFSSNSIFSLTFAIVDIRNLNFSNSISNKSLITISQSKKNPDRNNIF